MDFLNMLGENDVCFQSGTLRRAAFQMLRRILAFSTRTACSCVFFMEKCTHRSQ